MLAINASVVNLMVARPCAISTVAGRLRIITNYNWKGLHRGKIHNNSSLPHPLDMKRVTPTNRNYTVCMWLAKFRTTWSVGMQQPFTNEAKNNVFLLYITRAEVICQTSLSDTTNLADDRALSCRDIASRDFPIADLTVMLQWPLKVNQSISESMWFCKPHTNSY